MENTSYEYRNLPCTAGVWAVVGHDRIRDAVGVLEWCYDQSEAEERLAIMARYPQFSNLRVERW